MQDCTDYLDYCEFGELKSDMIWDHLVIGIRDSQLSERLQLEPELTLQRAEKLIRQQAVKEQKVILKQPANLAVPQQLDRVTQPTFKAPSRKQYQKRSPQIQRQLPTHPSWQNVRDVEKVLILENTAPHEMLPVIDVIAKDITKAQCFSKTISVHPPKIKKVTLILMSYT